MNSRCFRCGRTVEGGEGVLEVLVAVVKGDTLSTEQSDRVVHALCPADYTRRLN